jgi:hypothetical protein
MAKKKTNTNLYQPQGLTQTAMPLMPESALINPEAEKVGLGGTQLTNRKLNVVNVTPQGPQETETPKDTLFKGVDVSKSFSSKDFATKEDYEQAKLRAESFAQMGGYAKNIQQQEAEQQMAQQAQVLQELGAVGNISQTELNGLVEQYGLTGKQQLKEGLPGALREAIPSALQTGVTTGLGAAVVGAVGSGATAGAIGGPVGIAIGAAAGVVFGLWRGIRQARKSEAKEDVTNAMAEFTQMKTGMTQVATLASAGYINASEAVELYNAHLTRMLQIEAQIKYLQDTNLKDYLSDGSDDLAQVQSYLNNVAPVYAMRIRSALMNPTSKVPYSDIIMSDLGANNE